MTVADRLVKAIEAAPGRTEKQLSQDLFGPRSGQARINFTCRLLELRSLVERAGSGGRQDPYRYYVPPMGGTANVSGDDPRGLSVN